MKSKAMHLVAFTGLMAMASAVYAQATPTTGTIQLRGRISNATCTVQVNGQDPGDAVVGMGTFPTSAFQKAGDTAGGTGGSGQIHFMLTDCPGGPLKITFNATEVSGYPNAVELDSPSDANTAKNIGVHLYSQQLDPFTALTIGQTYTLTPATENNLTLLHFTAGYVATAAGVTAGVANATVGYSITYN